MWMEDMAAVGFPNLGEDDASESKEDRTEVDYGYETAMPERHARDHAAAANNNNNIDLGYGDAVPDSADCGYEDAMPDSALSTSSYHRHSYNSRAVPRRSSIKSNSPESIERRSSIGKSAGRGGTYSVHVRGEEHPVRRRRSIDFDKHTEIALIIPQADLSSHYQNDNDKRNAESTLWYQGEEINEMKRQRNKLVRKMRKNQLSEEEKGELLGIEKYLDRDSYKETKTQAWLSVFKEQDFQDMTGKYDEIKISQLYSQQTTEKSLMAKELAYNLRSQQEIKDYIETPRTKKLILLAHRRCSC